MSTRISTTFSPSSKLARWLIGASTILATSFCLPSASHAFGLIFSNSFSSGGANPINGIAVDSANNVFVLDPDGNARIQKFDLSTTPSTSSVIFPVDIPPVPDNASSPSGIALDGSGSIFFIDNGLGSIQKLNSSGNFLSALGDLTNPTGIAVDTSNNIFVADANGIQKFDSTNSFFQSTIISSLVANGIAVDSLGNIFVTDANNNIQKFDSAGMPLLTFGGGGNANGLLNNPTGIAVDNLGNIFVADTGNNRVQAFDSGGNYLAQVGTLGTENGQFDTPNPLAVNGSTLYVGDATARVQTFTIDPAAVPFEFSPNLGIGALGIIVAAKKLQKKKNQQEQPKEKQKVD